MVDLNASQWMSLIQLGMLTGATGQLVRTIAGAAKNTREKRLSLSEGGQRADDSWTVQTFLISLLVGAAAGAIAALALQPNLEKVPNDTILALLGAGYAGADFIEGFAGRYFQGNPIQNVRVLAPAPEPAPVAGPPPGGGPAAADPAAVAAAQVAAHAAANAAASVAAQAAAAAVQGANAAAPSSATPSIEPPVSTAVG